MQFVHASDLMLPSAFGFNYVQFIVVTRMLDTERYFRGENLFWHTANNEYDKTEQKFSDEEKNIADEKYIRFLNRINSSGFNPEISAIDVSIQPTIWLIGGTHRLGYLLSKNENIFVPVQFLMRQWPPVNAIEKYSDYPQNLMNEVINRYILLCNRLRRFLTGVIDYEIFVKHENFIINMIAQILNSTSIQKEEINLPNNDNEIRRHLFFVDKKVAVLRIQIDRLTLHYDGMESISWRSRGGG